MKYCKCSFLKTSVQYLGHLVDGEGLHATQEKIRALAEAPMPKDVTELMSFLGLLNYYGHFIPNLSSLLHPLSELLRCGVEFHRNGWQLKMKHSKLLRSRTPHTNVLVHYDPNVPLCL